MTTAAGSPARPRKAQWGAYEEDRRAVQRFDSALRLSPHAHTLVLDGVYVRDRDGRLGFHPLPEPTVAEVSEVAARTAARIERVLVAHGRDFDERSDSGDDQLSLDYPALASCYRAATAGQQLLCAHPGQPALPLVGQPRGRKTRQRATLVAEVRGVNVHAQRTRWGFGDPNPKVDGRDRRQLGRLCRYLARPPLAHERLAQLPDGRLSLSLKTPWSDGTEVIVLSPMDLIARLCAPVPPPRMHMLPGEGGRLEAARDPAVGGGSVGARAGDGVAT